jgi:capsular polysaccharide biosynthesis protein
VKERNKRYIMIGIVVGIVVSVIAIILWALLRDTSSSS